MLTQFRTHAGELVTGARLIAALNAVADSRIELAHAIRKENAYAKHVSEKTKEANLQEMLASAERIRSGNEDGGFWLWQLINTQLTGKCVALLPK